jgi:hypothetical protein
MEIEEPNRLNDLTDKFDPKVRKLMQDCLITEPNLPNPAMDRTEPVRA